MQQQAQAESKGMVNTIVDGATLKCVELRDRTLTIVKNPEHHKLAISTASGTAVFGVAGGAFGGATGILFGFAAGVPPALITFGLSIPVCTTMGGAGGAVFGTAIGGGAGAAAGFTTYKYRLEIKEGIVTVKVKAESAARTAHQSTKVRACALRDKASDAVAAARMKSGEIGTSVLGKASEQASAALTFASSTRAGVTSTAALSGGVVGTTAGGGAGVLVGAAVGVLPAIFTFGLSIPVGAALGLFCGSAVGGSVGVVSGGALGYGGFTYKEELGGLKAKIGF